MSALCCRDSSTSRGHKHQQLCSAPVLPQQHLTPVYSFFFLLHILQLSFFSYWVGLLCFVSPSLSSFFFFFCFFCFFCFFFLFFFRSSLHLFLSLSLFPLPSCSSPFAFTRLRPTARAPDSQIASPCTACGCVFNLFGPAERKDGRERTEEGRGRKKGRERKETSIYT